VISSDCCLLETSFVACLELRSASAGPFGTLWGMDDQDRSTRHEHLRRWIQDSFGELRVAWERQSKAAITVEDIASLPDAELDDLVWLRLNAEVEYGDRELIMALSPERRAYLVTRLLEWEIGNGGLHQFFFNYSHLADLCAEGYRVLGLNGQARKMRRVLRIARREKPVREAVTDWEGFAKSHRRTRLNRYDRCFMEHDAERIVFIRAHPERFTMPPIQG
jgi:hypothetical protein